MENLPETKKESFTITLPKPSVAGGQSLILVLLIAVGLIQTVQLFAIQKTAAAIKVGPTTSTPAATGGSGSSLPTMVGGC